MSYKLKFSDGFELDLKAFMKLERLPGGGVGYKSPSVVIPKILKKHYPSYYLEYESYLTKRKKALYRMDSLLQNIKKT